MNFLKFLFGKDLETKNPAVQPGTIYLDTAKNELWFDDPSNTSSTHNKVIDTATLIYKVTSTITFPSDGSDFEEGGSGDNTSSATAVLGQAILGTMTLGTK